MGNWITSLFGNSEARIAMLGLDAAGKTTILYKLRIGEVIPTTPTIGFNVETVKYKKIDFTVWDVGGQDRIRPLWRHYLEHTQAIIWVVDSNDRERVCGASDCAAEELAKVLSDPVLDNAALLVLANKQDLPQAMNVSDIAERLGLNNIHNRKWYITGTNAVTGEGLYEGLDWLAATIKNNGRGRGA